MDEKKQFAQRLVAAMTAAGYAPRPVVLEMQFNSRYWGKPVTYQAVRRWLLGMSIPEQDKLQVLSDWLMVEPHVLRFGTHGSGRVRHKKPTMPTEPSPRDKELLDTFHALPQAQRLLMLELMKALLRTPES